MKYKTFYLLVILNIFTLYINSSDLHALIEPIMTNVDIKSDEIVDKQYKLTPLILKDELNRIKKLSDEELKVHKNHMAKKLTCLSFFSAENALENFVNSTNIYIQFLTELEQYQKIYEIQKKLRLLKEKTQSTDNINKLGLAIINNEIDAEFKRRGLT